MSSDLKTAAYLKTHFEELVKHLIVVVDSQEENAVHQLRIHIKKLYALIKLLDQTEPESNIKKMFRPARSLFKLAGEIREIHLDLKKLKDLEKEHSDQKTALLEQLQKKSDQLSKKRTKWKDKINTLLTLFKKYDYRLNTALLHDHFRKLLVMASNFMHQGSFHEARKQIKSVLYLKDLLPEEKQDFMGIDFAFLEKLQEIMGYWNDLLNSSLRKDGNKENQFLQESFEKLNRELKASSREFLDTVYQKK